MFRIDTGQITVVEVCTAFVRAKYPNYGIVKIEGGDFIEGEGYFPTITISPNESFGDENIQVGLNVWVRDRPYIKWEGKTIYLERTAESVFRLLPDRTQASS